MTEAELSEIEERLGVDLPADYRRLLLGYPPDLESAKTDLGWKQESPSERQLVNDADRLVELNEDVRRPGTPWTDDDGPWPGRYFVIGDDECGNYWCIDLGGSGSEVWFYDHDLGGFEQHFGSLEEFAGELLRDVEAWNEEHRRNES
ncbi:SMI1/KNR4 family protein [Paludisphaera mucosa]|uniref:SMI1/KNR4 family protein n=1 Tax=Paludisphaera mucosa TaxID=3030827 RepID=A0ABT6FKK4_9BACT|nr:SMI1/KNR4 family protein [Paludisphaera mucosa]MDG3008089.1 SMI1/KNR4 family protein [Paludisphaera mucosa]